MKKLNSSMQTEVLKVFIFHILFRVFICENTSEILTRIVSEFDPKLVAITTTKNFKYDFIRVLDIPHVLFSECVENVYPDMYIFLIDKIEEIFVCQNIWNPSAKVVVIADMEENYSDARRVFDILWSHMAYDSVLIFSSKDSSVFWADPFSKENNCGRSVNELSRSGYRTKMKSCNLTISIREAPPFSGEQGGVEMEFIRVFARKFSFNLTWIKRPSTLNATLEQISHYYNQLAKNEFDLAIGGTAITLGKKNVSYLSSFDRHSMFLYLKTPELITGWKALLLMFPVSFWIILVISFSFILLISFFQTKISFISLFAILIQQSINLKIEKPNLKILFGTIYISFFVISSIYVTFIQTYTLKPPEEPPIKNLQQLLSKKYKIFSNRFNRNIFNQAKNEVFIELLQEVDMIENFGRIWKERIAVLESNYAMDFYIALKNVEAQQVGPFAHLYISPVVPKGSLYEKSLNYYIRLCVEYGLFDKWMRDMRHNLNKRKINRLKDEEKALNLRDVDGAFFVLIIGFHLSLFVFMFEVLYSRISKIRYFKLKQSKRQPH